MMTLGDFGTLTLDQARKKATREKAKVIEGQDPLVERKRNDPDFTIKQLADLYLSRHAVPLKKRPGSIRDDRSMLQNNILPVLGHKAVKAITRQDLEDLHLSMRQTPIRANRVLALLSKMFTLAEQWGYRDRNPVKGIERFHEEKRSDWLSEAQVKRLAAALIVHPNRRAANAVLLLMLTGTRKSEVLRAEWRQVDFERRTWTIPASNTKEKKIHVVPLARGALELMTSMYDLDPNGRFLFPGDKPGEHLKDLKRFWPQICEIANVNGFRIHDLRHTFASHLVSSGMSLEIVGRMLGHSQASTTQRYSHLADSPLREAADFISDLVTGEDDGKEGEEQHQSD